MLARSVGVLLILLGSSAWADTVHSLDTVGGQVKTPEGRAFVAEQMAGKPAPDRLGVQLSPGLSAAGIAGLLVPSGDHAAVTLTGAKPWPGHPDQYVAIVCTGGVGTLDKEPRCARDDPDEAVPLHVYLGIIEAKAGSAPRAVAASGPVTVKIDWRESGLPRMPMIAEDANGAPVPFARVQGFDLAAYTIAAGQTAIGLRVGWQESYSGGGADFTALLLFLVDGDRLKPILAVPMSAYADLAGDWHKDGTRDHEIIDAAHILTVSSTATNGHFDLVAKARAGAWKRVIKWDSAAGGYKPG